MRVVLVVAALATPALAQEWPGWRGPKGDGTSDEPRFPLRWSATENVVWKVSVPGLGHSSPVVWGDRIFLTTCLEQWTDKAKKAGTGERRLLCFDRRDGRQVWDRLVLTAPLERKHGLNNFASSTPVTDGRRVWAAFLNDKEFSVYCYDLEGNLAWKAVPGTFYSPHGFCSSPVLYKDLVIFNGDQDATAWIVAFDKETGQERWRADRPNKTRSYTPPVIYEAAGRPQLVLSGSKCVASYDPATGRQLWIIDGPTEQFVASLVQAEGLFFMVGGFPERYLVGIRPDGQGNVTATHVAWQHHGNKEEYSYVPSPVAWGSLFYVVGDRGVATCLDARTGKVLWSEELGRHHSASPVAAAGYLYFPDDQGVTHVLKAGPKFDLVARNDLGEECRASPALVKGRIYVRTVKSLVCIGEGEGR
jgi:hypothetical protein